MMSLPSTVKTKTFEARILRLQGMTSLQGFTIPGDIIKVFMASSLVLKALGASVAEARNIVFEGKASLLVCSPSHPLGVVVLGAQLTDKSGAPLRGEEARTELCSMVPFVEV